MQFFSVLDCQWRWWLEQAFVWSAQCSGPFTCVCVCVQARPHACVCVCARHCSPSIKKETKDFFSIHHQTIIGLPLNKAVLSNNSTDTYCGSVLHTWTHSYFSLRPFHSSLHLSSPLLSSPRVTAALHSNESHSWHVSRGVKCHLRRENEGAHRTRLGRSETSHSTGATRHSLLRDYTPQNESVLLDSNHFHCCSASYIQKF